MRHVPKFFSNKMKHDNTPMSSDANRHCTSDQLGTTVATDDPHMETIFTSLDRRLPLVRGILFIEDTFQHSLQHNAHACHSSRLIAGFR